MKISATQWIAWMILSATTVATVSAYAFSHFVTVDEAARYNGSVEKRLDRIETKVDELRARPSR